MENYVLTSSSQFLTVYSDGLYYSEVLTDRIHKLVTAGKMSSGFVNLVLQHTTGALLLVEHEAGIMMDLKSVLSKLVPEEDEYHHHIRGVDENGAGHVLSTLFNKTITVPVVTSTLQLGVYQEILFMDFQTEKTERSVAVTMLGETVS